MSHRIYTDIVQHVAMIGKLDIPESWVCVWEGGECGKSKRLMGDLFAKIENNKLYSVFLINTHEHANGGGINNAVFAPTPKQVEELKQCNFEEDGVLGSEYTECTFVLGLASVIKLLAEIKSVAEIQEEDSIQQQM